MTTTTTTASLSKSSRDVVHQLPSSPPATSSPSSLQQQAQQHQQQQQHGNQNALNLKKSDISLPATKTTEPIIADSQKISISNPSSSTPSPSLRHTRRSSRHSGPIDSCNKRDRSDESSSSSSHTNKLGVDIIDEGIEQRDKSSSSSSATTIKDKFAGPRGLPKLRVLHRALKSTLRTATSASTGT